MTQTQFQLFLGRNIPDAGQVTPEMMNDFINDEVSPRFDGFTITEGTGFWKGQQEKVTIITFITADGKTKVHQIADAFKTSFRQDSVLMTEQQLPVCQLVQWHTVCLHVHIMHYNKSMNKKLTPYYNGAVLMNETAANDPVVRMALDAMAKRQFQALEVPTGGTWYISDRH